MKINTPVTQREKPFPKGKYLVSKTDLKGIVTYANDAFVELSGFSREEIIGKNHNVVRHPDMPPDAFEDLWQTVKTGNPWRGLVKNRSRDGDHYWVDAYVVPVLKNGVAVGYMSVRSEPARADVTNAEALYRQIVGKQAKLPAKGNWLSHLTIRTKMIAAMGVLAVMLGIGTWIGISGQHSANQSIEQMYQQRQLPLSKISRISTLVGDARIQLMLALQHDPTSSRSKMHDHPLDNHFLRIMDGRQEVDKLLGELKGIELSPEDAQLVEKISAARLLYRTEGGTPMLEAIKRGDFDQAQAILLQKVNPQLDKYAELCDQLTQQMLENSKKDFEQSHQRAQTMTTLSVGGMLVGELIVLLGGFLLLRSFIQPLRQATGYFKRMSEGDLTEDIEISRQDETGQMLASLSIMQVHLKIMIDQVVGAANLIGQNSQLLQQEMQLVMQQSQDQHERVQSTAAATEEFTESVHEVAYSSAHAASSAKDSRRLVDESHVSIGRSMAATESVVTAVKASSHTISALDASIGKIGAITQTIKEIADQTNLLALNAAIEAARAGEQGRGFAVVADEVRKLAERTTSSTADISAMVGEIQTATHRAVLSMGTAVDEVEIGVGLMRESVECLTRITETSETISADATNIADASKEQSIASEQVANNMVQISTLIESNLSSANDAWEASKELAQHAKGLVAMVSDFELIKQL